MKIKLRPVRTYDVYAADGTPLGPFTVASEWEGLIKLESLDGKRETVIAAPLRDSDRFEKIFDAMFRGDTIQEYAQVVTASPDLAYQLKEATSGDGT